MSNVAVVALVAERLPAGLLHPGDPEANQPAKLIPLPGLNNLGISPQQAAQFADEAGLPTNDAPQLIAEAIVHLIETDGQSEIVPRTELDQLRARAATLDDVNPAAPTVAVHCRCEKWLFDVTLGRARVIVDGAALRKRIDDVCGCG